MTSSAASDDSSDPEHYLHAPVTVTGGWQGLDVVQRSEESDEEEMNRNENDYDEPKEANLWNRVGTRFPRAFHVFWKVLIPLFVIIMLCFLCGYFLVLLESGAEKQANDEALADIANRAMKISRIAQAARMAPSLCLEAYQGDITNRTELEQHMKDCGQRLPDLVEDALNELPLFELDVFDSLTFNWIVCGEESKHVAQVETVSDTWERKVENLTTEYEAHGMNATEAKTRAIEEASAQDVCTVNTAAGALFWLTIATTIGYGNTVPITKGGRALVYTCGFMSILIFTALVGQAGYICLVIADDFFQRRRMKRLAKGITSCLFWFSILCLWLLVIAGAAMAYTERRSGGNVAAHLNNAFWFSFISISTVGFGDYHIPHTQFMKRDMFYLPLMLLVGFVFFANFLLKLSDVLAEYVLKDTLEETLKQSREEREAETPSDAVDTR